MPLRLIPSQIFGALSSRSDFVVNEQKITQKKINPIAPTPAGSDKSMDGQLFPDFSLVVVQLLREITNPAMITSMCT
jgi:hypothetical protein